ncbi:hypothetical protein Patl1_07001 [Pistacia atlantica]|uniref:Uncharacterized protein n=1 Tax=Pistacia atlantica TaxID=434234 RepID=A0ACC1AKL1_9ROSI|nr:hypothetical protein Patl1_07001 [Pistacia atlantica]
MVDSQSTALIHLAASAPLKKLLKIQFLPLIIIFYHYLFFMVPLYPQWSAILLLSIDKKKTGYSEDKG